MSPFARTAALSGFPRGASGSSSVIVRKERNASVHWASAILGIAAKKLSATINTKQEAILYFVICFFYLPERESQKPPFLKRY
ncbi:MAG: hypothetical protein PPP56_05535 [Longimonas sp.]|uniref:hypothetical protein n=1 Tax=Longimonas sp. TaxID=2039626 RepID=UPI003357283A